MAQLKSTSVTGNLSVTGNTVASSFIKHDGLSNQFLMADGHVENAQEFNQNFVLKDTSILGVKQLQLYSENFNDSAYDHIYVGKTNDFIKHRTKAQFIQDLELSQVYNYKGTLADLNALKLIASARVGDVYFISATSDNWACKQKVTAATGDNYATYWQSIGNIISLSGYVTKDTDQTITGVKTFTKNVIINNNLLSIKAINENDDSWIRFSNYSDSGFYAVGIRRPYENYGLQLKIHPVSGDDTYYSIWHTGNLQGNKDCIPKFTGANTIGNSNITDDGSTVSIDANVNICNGKQIYFQKLPDETADYHTGAIMTYNRGSGAIVPLQIYGTKTSDGWHGFCVGWNNMGFNILAKTFENGLYSTKDNRWILHHKYSSSGKAEFIELGAPTGSNTELIPYIDLCANEVKIKGEKLSINSTVSFTYNSTDKCIDVLFT